MRILRHRNWLLAFLLGCGSQFGASCVDQPSFAADGAASQQQSNAGRLVGIKKRTPWSTSRITGTPEPPPPYTIERVFPNLQFVNPVVLTNAPGTDRLFVMEVSGKIYSFPNDSHCRKADLVADLSQIEGMERAYGLTFHPDFETNRVCYASYVLKADLPEGTRVSRFTMESLDPFRFDPADEEIVITWLSGGHNGACLKFGLDGFLYISTGDGAGAFPPDSRNSGQDVSNLLASILRIDVDHPQAGRPYTIPSDNPFVDLDGARGEIWCYGHRNPWKMSVDSVTGDLWVGDVGWEMWEMIYRVQKGSNYGWSIMEASQLVHPERQRGPTPIVPPTIAHSHTESRSITGGFVYRGSRLPELHGNYIYGDYVTGKMWGGRHDGNRLVSLIELADTPIQIICFGIDNSDELYFMSYGEQAMIYRLVANPSAQANADFPTRLSDTGLFASVRNQIPAPGVIPYSINAEPWADFAVAERFVALPGTSRLGIYESSNVQIGYIKGEWAFPNDAVLVKTIGLDLKKGNPASRQRLETQIFHRHDDAWRAYTYIWQDDQSDAILSDGAGFDRTFTVVDPTAPNGNRKQVWHFASRTECLLCHTTRAGTVHGFKPEQLHKDHDYGDVTADQLHTLTAIDLLESPPGKDVGSMPDPHDASADLNDRARAYLHVNCGHCHRRGGGGTAAIDVQYHFPIQKTNLLNARPTQGSFGIHGAQVFSPGDPYRSVLYYRMAKLGRGRMPHFGSTVVDEAGLALIHDWMKSFPAGDASAGTRKSVQNQRHAQQKLIETLRNSDSDAAGIVDAAVDQLLTSTSAALMLVTLLGEGEVQPSLRRQVIDKAVAQTDLQVRDLFERFIPLDKRVKRLGSAVKPEQILAIAGDAARGRELFLQTAGVQCRNCHQVHNMGKELGPDLSQIGKKYARAELLESILEPSKKIEPKFMAYLVETVQGKVHTGLLVERSNEQVVLKDATNKPVRIAADDIELIVPQRKSLMPELLVQDMTAQQVADLLEFLAGLKPKQ